MMSKMQTSNLAVIKITTALVGIFMNIIFAYFFQIKGVVFSSLFGLANTGSAACARPITVMLLAPRPAPVT